MKDIHMKLYLGGVCVFIRLAAAAAAALPVTFHCNYTRPYVPPSSQTFFSPYTTPLLGTLGRYCTLSYTLNPPNPTSRIMCDLLLHTCKKIKAQKKHKSQV
ncbi:hypothetical protein F4811DRAFT_515807, partial [Daldinia bambusicola]